MQVRTTPQVQVDEKKSRGFILGSLSFGHGITHLFSQGFPLLLTEIASAQHMGLSTIQTASIFAAKHGGGAAVNLGGGPVVDMLKSQWGRILTATMVLFAISFAIMGSSPNFTILVIAVIFGAMPGSLWHLPATAALSQRFPDRRGFAISMHGFGANIGNILGPLLAGALLGVFLWRHVFYIYALPALVVAIFVWCSLRNVGRVGDREERKELGTRFRDSLMLFKNPIVVGLLLAAIFRGVGLGAVMNWTPFYLKEESGLGMGNFEAGFYQALLVGTGIVSTPVLGALSDKLGRKPIMVPGLLVATVLASLVVTTGNSLLLIPVLAGMGLFSFALHQVIQAAVLDEVGRGTEATTIGLLFGFNAAIGIASPFVVSLIVDHLGGYGSIYYFAAILNSTFRYSYYNHPPGYPESAHRI